MQIYFKEKQVWRALIEAVTGLKSMHDINVMHRDIKCANIFLSKCQDCEDKDLFKCKLGDMNVSKVTGPKGLNYTQTGTPYYASPEVWKDEPYSYKSDIWSLGCVIYEMLALKPPFNAKDMN
jgi:NIMA (never in mitosis gene a)-related kinase